MTKRPPPRGVDQATWDAVNWTDTDTDIAKRLGIARQTVNKARLAAGIPPASVYRRRVVLPLVERLYREGLPMSKIGERIGMHEETVARIVEEHKLVRREGVRRTRMPSRMKYPWNDVDWSLTNSELATQLSATYHTVWRARKRFAAPEYQDRGLLNDEE